MAAVFTTNGGAAVEFTTAGGFRVELAAGPRGTDGEDGADGADGLPGTAGTNGDPGSQIRNGTGAPSDALGIDGDYYLDTDSNELYQRSAGAYVLLCELGGGSGLPDATGVPDGYFLGVSSEVATWMPVTAEDVVAAFAIAAFAKSAPNTTTLLYRRGDTLTGVAAGASYTSGPPVSASIANTLGGSVGVGDVAPGAWTISTPFATASMGGTVKRNGLDAGADPTMVATLTAIKGTTKTASFTITWTRDVFYGLGDGVDTEAEIEALTSTLSTTRARTITLSPSDQYVNYWYPNSYGAATFTLNGFPAAFDSMGTVSVTNANGIVSTYRGYRSTNRLTGTSLNFVVT